MNKHSILGKTLNMSGILCFLITLIFGQRSSACSIACLTISLIAAGMYLIYPHRFSVVPRREFQRKRDRSKVSDISTAMLLPCIALCLRTLYLDFSYTCWPIILVIGAVIGIIASILFYIRSEEMRRYKTEFYLTAICCILFAASAVCQINYIADFGPAPPVNCQVIETDYMSPRKGPDLYQCLAETATGDTLRMRIRRSTFDRLQYENVLAVYIGKGALGIEYAYPSE